MKYVERRDVGEGEKGRRSGGGWGCVGEGGGGGECSVKLSPGHIVL